MNLKKTIVSLMAAGAVVAGGFAGVAAQEVTPGPANQPLTVTVANDGVFNVEFCGGETAGVFPDLNLTSENFDQDARTLTTETSICYTDTQAQRGQYRAQLSAGDFTGSGDNEISAEHLKLGEISIMNSGQWGPGVGSIAALDGSGGSINGTAPEDRVAKWGGGNFAEGPLHVHNIWAGAGTAGQKYLDDEYDYPQDIRSDNGSWQDIDLVLEVPVETVSDDYTSTLTITLTPGNLD